MNRSRRELLAGLGAAAAIGACGSRPGRRRDAPRDRDPPSVIAVGSGDVDGRRAVIWARASAPGRMQLAWRRTADRADQERRVLGPAIGAGSGLCGAIDVGDLPPGDIEYRVIVEDERGRAGTAASGRLRVRTAGDPIAIAWSGDVGGQGWGIDRARGGMTLFEVMRRAAPDLFVHSGDAIYADDPLPADIGLADGTRWTNVVTPARSRVAETLDEFRANFDYNLLDDHYRRFLAEVPVVAQWDDHETLNNWWPGEQLDDPRRRERDVDVLAARARRAFLDHFPVRRAGGRIHRLIQPHPEIAIAVLDARSFRGPNGDGLDSVPGPGVALLGAAQAGWLVDALARSRATWKIVACDQPISTIIGDGDAIDPGGSVRRLHEGTGQGDAGLPRGREHEIAAILAQLAARRVTNVVWVTADVHYAAAHRYDPARARFTGFAPFWELIAGPIHAGVFSANPVDPTFGPEIAFQRSIPPELEGAGPASGLMSFGMLTFDPRTRALAIALRGQDGATLWSIELPPA